MRPAATVRHKAIVFQSDPEEIRSRLHVRSPPEAVYAAVATAEGGSHERIPARRFVTDCFGWTVAFELAGHKDAGQATGADDEVGLARIADTRDVADMGGGDLVQMPAANKRQVGVVGVLAGRPTRPFDHLGIRRACCRPT